MGDQELTAPTGPDLEEETEEEKIQLLVAKLDVSEKEAKMALDSAEGDLQEAESIIQLLNKDHYIFLFKGADLEMDAPFAGIGFGKGGEGGTLTIMLYPLADEDAYAVMSVEEEVEEFYKKALFNAPDEDSPAGTLDWVRRKIDIEAALKPHVERIHQLIRESEWDELNEWMQDILMNPLPELEHFTVYGDTCSAFDINKMVKNLKIEASLVGEEEETPPGLEDMDITLHCNVEVSPVGGRRADMLRIGDKVAVRIADQRDIAIYVAELLGGLKGGEVRPLLARVEEIESVATGRLKVRVSFGPGVRGEFSTLKDVKIAFETISDKEIEKLSTPPEPVFHERQYNKITSYLLWLIALAFAIMAVIYWVG